MSQISPSAMSRLWQLARERGASAASPLSREVDLSGRCSSPFYRDYSALAEDPVLWHLRKGKKGYLYINEGYKGLGKPLKGIQWDGSHYEPRKVRRPPIIYADVWLPCRKCENCLRARAALWRQRASVELDASTRTWFGTFTINPYHRFLIDTRADRPSSSEDDLYLSRHAQISKYFTLYFKRLRKASRSKIRYLLVAEHHADGWPHYHCLIHERGSPVTKRQLQGEWPYGFTNFKLVDCADKRVAGYICKYISKQALARMRASLKYGTL